MRNTSNAQMSGNPLVRSKFVLVGAAILIVGALSVLVLWDDIVLEQSETEAAGSGRGSTLALANPASVNCTEKGGTSEIRNGEKGQTGYCRFSDGRVCEEWALFRDNRCTPPE